MKTMREYIDLIKESIDDDWFKSGAFMTYKKPSKERYEIAQQDGTIETLEGPVNYKKGYYIYLNGSPEELKLLDEKLKDIGADIVTGDEEKRIIDKIKAEEENAASGMGMIFG